MLESGTSMSLQVRCSNFWPISHQSSYRFLVPFTVHFREFDASHTLYFLIDKFVKVRVSRVLALVNHLYTIIDDSSSELTSGVEAYGDTWVEQVAFARPSVMDTDFGKVRAMPSPADSYQLSLPLTGFRVVPNFPSKATFMDFSELVSICNFDVLDAAIPVGSRLVIVILETTSCQGAARVAPLRSVNHSGGIAVLWNNGNIHA
ncbi:hypothetical protein Cgig2_024052 [Carnegiea gigantea]|uniref:Uncharacterized protein n=1 Tax=Carnegiea gigantea TaxID=171969 RepID=A0A9Q1KJH0_9CARY|nr:hypothetical protein Cgig2_024052 [Carnegiea gigantea]